MLTSNTFIKYCAWLRGKKTLTANDLKALSAAINSRASTSQLIILTDLALNCNCLTPHGLLVAYRARTDLYGDTRLVPEFKQNSAFSICTLAQEV